MPPDARAQDREALEWSIAMADRAGTRDDRRSLEAALKIARTAAAALPNGGAVTERARLRLPEGQLMFITRDYAAANQAAAETASMAEEASLFSIVATARLTEAWIQTWTETSLHEFQRVADRAVEACERAGDRAAEIEARYVATYVPFSAARLSEFVETNELLIAQARAIGDPAHEATISARLAGIEILRGSVEAAARTPISLEVQAACI